MYVRIYIYMHAYMHIDLHVSDYLSLLCPLSLSLYTHTLTLTHTHIYIYIYVLYFDQGNTPEGSDTFQRPVIERDRVDGLRLMIWEKVKVPFCHYSHAPEESNL